MQNIHDVISTLQADAPLGTSPGREHERLAAFAGTWRMTGRNLSAAPLEADTRLEGEASYQFFPGGFFLFGVDTSRAAQGAHTTLSCYGYDAETRLYRAHFFDNAGFHREYAGEVDENDVWHFSGRFERVKIAPQQGGDVLFHFWERLVEGRWQPLCEFTLTRQALAH